MNAFSLAFTFICSVLIVSLPRRLAAVPLLVGATYATPWAILEVGPAHFTVLRILVAVGVLRVLARGEQMANGISPVDRWMFLWAAVLFATSAFHSSDA